MPIRDRRYEIGLLVLLALANGVVALDRLTAAYLTPYIVRELHLSNTQLGLLGGALSLAVAISSVWIGRLADATGRRKTILILCTVIFSVGSRWAASPPAFFSCSRRGSCSASRKGRWCRSAKR